MVEESMSMVDSMKKYGRRMMKAAPRAPVREPSEEPGPEEGLSGAEPGQEEQEGDRRQNSKQKGRPPQQDQKCCKEVLPSTQPLKKRGQRRKLLRKDTTEKVRDQPVEEEEEEDEEDVAPRKKQRITRPAGSKAGPAKPKPLNKGKAPAVAGGDIVAPVPAASNSKTKPTPKPKTKGRPGRIPQNAGASGDEADVGETSFAALQRGPPMPKSCGLVSMRGGLGDYIQTRSGRHSYRPVEYWRGEQVVREDEEQADMFAKDRFVMPSIKEVIRVPVEEVRSRAGAAKGKARPNTKKPVVEEEYEGWEINPGTVKGEIVLWETEYEEHPPADDEPVEVTDACIAVSAKAAQPLEIRNATFQFTKTLTMPFMGAGVVDLPPGGEKRLKNSRKLHMVFFVHTGKVMVTINKAQFRISAGGIWFVPRGSYYSITNDYDNASRLFFCHACEILAA